MNQNLLIIGAGIYGLVAKEIAESMGCFRRIGFADDGAKETPNGIPVVGTTQDLSALSKEYADVVVAIGNPEVRQRLVEFIEEETLLRLVTLVSPRAYVSPSAQIGKGCIVEPMAVVHTGCLLGKGCLICAGAVVNHGAMCGDWVQVDCNATVAGNTVVPAGVKVASGTVYEKKIPYCPVSVDGSEFRFEDGM